MQVELSQLLTYCAGAVRMTSSEKIIYVCEVNKLKNVNANN